MKIFTNIFRAQGKKRYEKYKEEARRLVHERLAYYNSAFYQYPYGRVSIKNHKTRWGSCSSKGNLNFNYKIVFLPQHLADYIIVHELCHLGEFNHSAAFWKLVERADPEYRKHRIELRKPF